MTKLKDKYNSIDVIDKLEDEVNKHPLKDDLEYAINLAKEILQGDKDYSDRIFTLTQYGDTHAKARNTLGVIIALILGTIGISIYSIFKYPQILIILILGEILDYSIYKSYKKYKKKKD